MDLKRVSLSEINAWVDFLTEKFTYGAYIDGKVVKDNDIDWDKYRTIPIDIMNKKKVGICWDFVNYEHASLEKLNINHDCYLFLSTNSKDAGTIITHTFIIMDIHGDNYWIEAAWNKHSGVHHISSVDSVVKMLQAEYGKNPYDLIRYNPKGLDMGLTSQQYLDYIYQHGTMERRRHIG